MSGVKLLVLRVDKPNINKYIGDVIDVLPVDTFEGLEVQKPHKTYVRIIVPDLTIEEDLILELLDGVKTMIKPSITDPFYTELFTKGFVTVDKLTLLNYTRSTNA